MVNLETSFMRPRRWRPPANKCPQVQPFNHLNYKARQMTFRQPLVHRWRQQKPRLAVYLPKVAHPLTAPGIPSFQSYNIMRHLPPKSDRLLAGNFGLSETGSLMTVSSSDLPKDFASGNGTARLYVDDEANAQQCHEGKASCERRLEAERNARRHLSVAALTGSP
jgi:hypothetical protein